ncbi:unnamed protein product [Cuscuta europaea]|uniref:Uncharacterized protein n=1 Tax=Cuscuta europaea TaxID=41803 RepID=A0A9P0ZGY9_CUSEU|nr:unnamed protein product [Cuscuta europaea]
MREPREGEWEVSRDSEIAGQTEVAHQGINRATGGSCALFVLTIIAMVRPPPEPPPGDERGARVQDTRFAYLVFFMFRSPPISFYYFIICFLITVYIVRFASLFGNLASFYVIGYVWIYGNKDGCVKPAAWLAICVTLLGVTVSKSDHRVYSHSCWSLVGDRFVFPLTDVMILKLMI